MPHATTSRYWRPVRVALQQARRGSEPSDADRDLAHAIARPLLALGQSDRAAQLSEHFLPDERGAAVRTEDLIAARTDPPSVRQRHPRAGTGASVSPATR